jgi:HD domain-containing protein
MAGRTLVARWVAVLSIAALVPAFYLTGPESRWDQPVLLVALAAIALVSLWSLVAINSTVFFDAEFVAVLLALAFLGPLPAATVWLAAEAVYLVLNRRPSEAHVANIASFGWAVLAGALVLEAFGAGHPTAASGPAGYGALALAAVTVIAVNFAVARGIVGLIVDRRPVRVLVREELLRPAPATALMIAGGVLTAFLYTRMGVFALGLFCVVVAVPQVVFPILLKPRPVNQMAFSDAVALYASAIGRTLGLDSEARQVMQDAATFLSMKVYGPVQGNLRSAEFDHWSAVQETLLFYREHWDAPGGTPGALSGDLIPVTSRILAVADVWARLTAANSPELSHQQALIVLRSRAGYHFDPAVVEAVAEIAEAQQAGSRAETAFQPQLRHLPLPPAFVAPLHPVTGELA